MAHGHMVADKAAMTCYASSARGARLLWGYCLLQNLSQQQEARNKESSLLPTAADAKTIRCECSELFRARSEQARCLHAGAPTAIAGLTLAPPDDLLHIWEQLQRTGHNSADFIAASSASPAQLNAYGSPRTPAPMAVLHRVNTDDKLLAPSVPYNTRSRVLHKQQSKIASSDRYAPDYCTVRAVLVFLWLAVVQCLGPWRHRRVTLLLKRNRPLCCCDRMSIVLSASQPAATAAADGLGSSGPRLLPADYWWYAGSCPAVDTADGAAQQPKLRT
eukprot:GHUV01029876.1.p1 GENE.GHUV01029876.1~~GHUV01029876.1.p1  ORF type:complete len:275 (-),score=68.31 GHUV01029876.1:42-866(-)